MTDTPAETNLPNRKIIASFSLAAAGDDDALTLFFEGVLEGPLYVPHRHQHYPMSDQPQYPNDFVHVLGVQDGPRTIVPAFSAVDDIQTWCGSELSYRAFEGSRLLDAVPEEWWIIINPGQEWEKELSPWEIKTLKGGPLAIQEVVQELRNEEEEMVQTLGLRQISNEEYPSLIQTLQDFGSGLDAVRGVYLAEEYGVTLEGEDTRELVLGIEAPQSSAEEMNELKELCRAHIAPLLIGDTPAKIYIGNGVHSSLALSMFNSLEPVYGHHTPDSESK